MEHITVLGAVILLSPAWLLLILQEVIRRKK